MPPKKKSTCDAAIDTPDPIEFDPFNLDGHRLREEYLAIPKFTRKILEKLKQQNTTGAPKVVKDEVVENMEMLLDWMRSFALLLDQSRTFSNRLQGIERFRCDDEEGFRGIEITHSLGEVGFIDVRNEPERHGAFAVMLEGFVGHHGSASTGIIRAKP